MNANRLSPELIDRELGTWLRDETETRAPARLVEDVFARTSRMPQVRRWPWTPAPRRTGGRPSVVSTPGIRGSARRPWVIAGLAAVLAIALALGIGSRRFGPGPGSTGGPSPSTRPAPSASASPNLTAVPSATVSPVPTVIGGLRATRIPLGTDAGPIDVVDAFGSIWVADIHANDVRRLDESTGREVARIPLPSASWFGVTDDGLWVTSQNNTGITRIDPVTNTAREHLGDVAPCGAPVVTSTSLWQAGCDAGVYLRIDPKTHALIDTVPTAGHGMLVLAGGRLITTGPDGLAQLDPATSTYTTIGGPAARQADFIASDGTTVWVGNQAGVARLDPTNGDALASFPYPNAEVITFSGDHAWITVTDQGIVEVALATNQVRRTIPLLPTPVVAREAAGALWVTDFNASDLWRVEL